MATAPTAKEERIQARGVPHAERLARRLDKPMGALGVLFLFVVLGQTVADDGRVLGAFAVVGWVLWSVFVAEFALRALAERGDRGGGACLQPDPASGRVVRLLCRCSERGGDGTITGSRLSPDAGLATLLEVVLAVYSVAVFATLAAALGAYFLGPRVAATHAPVETSRPG